MADYRDRYREIRATGASLAAISVDPPRKSEAVRLRMDLPFPILCDTERRLVREWDVYNPREKGGIAKPAAFVIEPDRKVRFAAIDSVTTRVPVSEMLKVLQSVRDGRQVRRKAHIPRLADWFRGIANYLGG